MKVPAALLREIIASLVDEEIRKVKGGYKVYPKKPQKGRKTRRALSKKPMSREKALRQLRAVERNKSLKESYDVHTVDEIEEAVVRALEILDIDSPNLKNFMIRIARTESGGNAEGLETITGHEGDPFQLDTPATDEVKLNINMRLWRAFIDNKEGDNPANLTLDMASQKHSEIESNVTLGALFATLYVIWRLGSTATRSIWNPENRSSIDRYVPSDLESQASFWKREYNTSSGKGTEEDFKNKNA